MPALQLSAPLVLPTVLLACVMVTQTACTPEQATTNRGEVAEGAELSVGLQSEHLKSFGDDDSLLVVVGEWNTFENLEAAESSGALGSLVGQHAAGGLPEES